MFNRNKRSKIGWSSNDDIQMERHGTATWIYDHTGMLVGKTEPFGNGYKVNVMYGYNPDNGFFKLGLVSKKSKALDEFRRMYGYL